jgi:hypothetical protein
MIRGRRPLAANASGRNGQGLRRDSMPNLHLENASAMARKVLMSHLCDRKI